MNKVLIDTNVLIYALDKNSGFNARALEILKRNDFQLYITSKNISEYFAVCTKLKVDIITIIGFYDEIKKNTTILFPNQSSLNIFENLFRKYNPKGNRIYDLEIISMMIANEIVTVATFNEKDFVTISEITLLPSL